MVDEITNLSDEEKEALGIKEPEEADNTEVETPEEPKETEAEEPKEPEDKKEDEPEDEDVEDDDVPARRVPQVPYRKFKEEREKRKELEDTVSSLQEEIESIKNSDKTVAQKEDDIEKLAEEFGVDPSFAKKLSDNITAKIKPNISEDDLAAWKAEREAKHQDELFLDELDNLAELKPEAASHKKELYELAFSPKYSGKNFKPLLEIYLREIEPNTTKSKTMESSKKKADTGVLDYENISDEEALKLPNDKFLEWSEYKARNSN